MQRLCLCSRKIVSPQTIPDKQAYAAIGQPVLMSMYGQEFQKKKMQVAQVLLTREGLDDRKRYLNAKHALQALLKKNVVPIINENDTVTVEEIKIGDNDQLSAYVAELIEADLLILLSHVEGFYDQNPKKSGAELIPVIRKIDQKIYDKVFDGFSERTTGGMTTKLMAAKHCLKAGIPMLITSGFQKNFVKQILGKKVEGTLFLPSQKTVGARKRWISTIRTKGKLFIDGGAKKALLVGKKSLLSSGVVAVEGSFNTGDCIEICTKNGIVLAKGICSYSREEVEKIMGSQSAEIQKILGYKYSDEIIHRDDMVIQS